MAREQLNDGEKLGAIRGKINNNFIEVYDSKLEASQVLVKTNTSPYTPTTPYHPATKNYADGLQTAMIALYDPTNKSGDAFARANHHGTIPPSVVLEDLDNRFVTDIQISSWDSKEPSIGTKGTAFNKNFGTVAGSVAYGDHVHTGTYEPSNANIQTHVNQTAGNPHGVDAFDIGLQFVDNTSDSAKPISVLTQAALDEKQQIAAAVYQGFNTTNSDPSHAEGRLFYNQLHKALSYYNEVSDVTVNIGQELVGRVYNDTGVLITNGTPVYFTGAIDAPSKRPKVAPAIASDYVKSRVVGVMTHDCEAASIGYVAALGEVHDFDTSSFSDGDLIYLSETVAGAYVTDPPFIRTLVGTVIYSDATEGVICVKPDVNITPPTAFGQLDGISSTYNLTTSYQDFIGYSNTIAQAIETNATTGIIEISYDGIYRINVNSSMSFSSSPSTRTIDIQIYNVTDSVSVFDTHITVAKDATSVSRSIAPAFTLEAAHEYKLRIKSSVAISSVTFGSLSFDVQSISAET